MAKKKNEVKASTATSGFKGKNTFNYDLGGFGSATSQTQKGSNEINTTATLAPGLQQTQQNAIAGVNNNQGFINMTPTQQLQDLEAGNNVFYNTQSAFNRRLATQALSQAQSRYSSSGLENSTARGAFESQLTTDDILRDLATRESALTQQNALAQSNIGINAALLDQLYGYLDPLAATANQNLYQALGSNDQMAMFNANQQQQAATQTAQLREARAQRWSQFWGNVITGASNAAAAGMGAKK